MRRLSFTAFALVLLASACRGGGPVPGQSPTAPATSPSPSSPSTSPSPSTGNLGGTELRLEQVAIMEEPIALGYRKGDPALYVIERGGRMFAIRDGQPDQHPLLDISSDITADGERGLLGMAFSPDGRFVYLNYTDLNGDTNVDEYSMGDQGPVASSRRRVLFIKQPYPNHNGGNLAFGPDGHLYIGMGDGGSGGDPQGNGQNLGALLAKMLRIDPRPSGGKPYGVPAGNPFVGRSGARPEVWALGLRNPWRYTFDRTTGDLWIGDVGQGAWEEVDHQTASSSGGENYGWNRYEGRHLYDGPKLASAVPPVYEYSHDTGECAITGGYVYRGSSIPPMQGWYLFADFCIGDVMAFRLQDGKASQPVDLGLNVAGLASFGEDQAGELYALSLSDGGVYKIVPAAT